jgi:hypothetical protein
MRFGKLISTAVVPMFIFACGDSSSDDMFNNAKAEEPVETPKDSVLKPNTPDSLLTPITRDYSLIWSGEGTQENPFLVSSAEDLISIEFYVNDSAMAFKDKFFKQTADIALSGAWTPIGVKGTIDRPFSGHYDGGSKTISGLTINDTTGYSGLFGLVRAAHVSNVVLKDVKMAAGSYAGALIGKADTVTIENCSVENAEITGTDRVGGLVGEATKLSVKGVAVSGAVTGTNNVGGVVGSVQNVVLSTSVNNAVVTGKSAVGGIVGTSANVGDAGTISEVLNHGAVTGTTNVAGVVAKLSNTKLEKSGNYGAVSADESQSERPMGSVGGVVADASNNSSVNEVFNMAAVTVNKNVAVGGIAGKIKGAEIANAFNHGDITGAASYIGGLVGNIDLEATLKSAYNKGQVPDNNVSGAVAGNMNSVSTVTNVYYDKTVAGSCLVVAKSMNAELPTGVSTEEMKTAAFITQLGSAEGVWTIDATKNDGYPVFAWIK